MTGWYGNDSPPENRFYGQLSEDRHHREYDRLHRKLKEREEKLLRERYPNIAAIQDEIDEAQKHYDDAEEALTHQGIALEKLKEERKLLERLLGIDDV